MGNIRDGVRINGKKPNGWQLRNLNMQRKEVPPAMPTQWERFCVKNGIVDPLVALQNGKRRVIKEWVLAHYNSLYCPEDVLIELGIESRWIS